MKNKSEHRRITMEQKKMPRKIKTIEGNKIEKKNSDNNSSNED